MKSIWTQLVAALLACTVLSVPDVSDFDWKTIAPSSSLNYSSCYNGHRCAKLEVPLDWLDPDKSARVTLAIIARPAVVAEDDPSFGGTIIVNPGGPSGSGVSFLLRAGEVIQSSADGVKKYEILSFDPRGVGLTTPNSDCFLDEFARDTSSIEERAMGALDEGPSVVRGRISRATAFGRLCEAGVVDENIRAFMSTSSVARDMVEIVDNLDELRKESSSRKTGEEPGNFELRSEEKDRTPRIQYWGFSYGTVLGNYFASMFPGRVGRMILEAVEDVYDYYNATWALNLADTQKVLDHLWDTCYDAGPNCDLYESTDKSPSDIQDRVRAFLDALEESPHPFLSQSTVTSITKQDILSTVIFNPLYQPQREFTRLATTLSEAMSGNFTSVYKAIGSPDSCPLQIPTTYTWNKDAQSAIACGDGESQENLTVADIQSHIDRLKFDSPEFGASWAGIRLQCKGWPASVRPKYSFSGPWTTPEADPGLVEGRPAAPLLFASSRIDPVTPLRNAYEASKGHPGSRVLIQNNAGHGSLYSPGKCREDFIKKYFDLGELPPEGTVCQPDCVPFGDCPQIEAVAFNSLDVLEGRSKRSPLEMF